MLSYRLPRQFSLPIGKLPLFLIAAWTLSMIAVPITKWTMGEGAIYPLISFSVVLQASAVASILCTAWGGWQTLKIAAIIILVTLAAETLGSNTGFPFGPYHYTDRLQPRIGTVPLLIPLAWFMMAPSAWAVAHRYRRKAWLFILVSALALVAWDLLLDPQMVHWDLWQWEVPGLYFGIPLSNYAGWLLVSIVLTALIRPDKLPVRPLLLVYTITWFLEVFGLAFFWGMPGPALIGGIAMGFFVWLGWRSTLKTQTGEEAW
jgi:putative membrane protein